MRPTRFARHLSVSSTIRLLTMAGLLAGYALRLHKLGSESLWYDETVSAFLARQSIPQILAHTARDIHPPAYYLLLRAWTLMGNPTAQSGLEFHLAYLSLWFGMLILALLAPLAKDALGATARPAVVWAAALSPFLVWYSQEVRMYTLAGALALLSLYAAVRYAEFAPRGDNRKGAVWLAIYVAAAAVALYTLYYSVFALLAVNVGVGYSLWRRRQYMSTGRQLSDWLLAQFSVLALFLPWAPIALRQVIDPPVPVWRVPWSSWTSVVSDLAIGLSALLVGQSVLTSQVGFWALLTVAVALAFVRYTKSGRCATALPHAAQWYLVYVFGPLLLLFFISASVTPIFHVRYLATYAPAFSIILTGGLLFVFRRNALLGVLAVSLITAGSASSLYRFWTHPDFVSDDHRGAVQRMATGWRPGDVILANAGWVYTAIATYWPVDVTLLPAHCGTDPDTARPAPLSSWTRLPSVLDGLPFRFTNQADASVYAPALMTGSVNGPASLGWGTPQADFFSMSSEDALASLSALNREGHRIWHYRLYDTVSDPDGLLRSWLEQNMRLVDSQPFAGRDFLRLELYEPIRSPMGPQSSPAQTEGVQDRFGAALALLNRPQDASLHAGDTLYIPLDLRAEEGISAITAPLSISLRLLDDAGKVWAQQDEALDAPVDGWVPDAELRQWLALPVRAVTPPGQYAIAALLYPQDTLIPIAVTSAGSADSSTSLHLADIHIAQPLTVPRIAMQPAAVFEHLELIRSCLGTHSSMPGDSVTLDLLWRPRLNVPADGYLARIDLMAGDGAVAQTWLEPLEWGRYPTADGSTQGASGFPVRDLHTIKLTEDLHPGDYWVALALERAQDGLRIAVRKPWWSPITSQSLNLGAIRVDAPAP